MKPSRARWRGIVAFVVALVLAGGGVRVTYAAYNARTSNGTTLATATLAAPGGVGTTLQSDGGTAQVSWSATTSTWATGHRVYRATSSGGPFSLVTQIANRTTLSYSEQPGSGTYYYQVRAYYTGNGANWESQANNQAGPIKPLDHFALAFGAVHIRNVPFNVTITALASDGSTVTAFTGTVALTSSVGPVSPATSDAFSAGTLTQSLSIAPTSILPNLATTLTATGGSPTCTGQSASFILV